MSAISIPCPCCGQHKITGDFPPTSVCSVKCTNNENATAIISVDSKGGIDVDCRIKQPEPKPDNCFIATAAYGSPLASEVQFLREIRDNILRKTRWGKEFFDVYWQYYYQISPGIAEQMRENPKLLSIIRWSIVIPWVNYIKLLEARPDWNRVEMDNLEPGLRKLLSQMQTDMESWIAAIDLPRSFDNYTPVEAAQELNVFLDFLRYSNGLKYLEELVKCNALPLHYEVHDEVNLLNVLREAGRSEEEIEYILYKQE